MAMVSVAALAIGASATNARAIDPCAGAAAPPATEVDAAALRDAFEAARPRSTPSAEHVASRLAAWRDDVAELRDHACRANRILRAESAELFDLRMACVERGVRDVEALVAALRAPSPALVDGAFEAIDHATDLTRCRGERVALVGFGPEPAAAAALRGRLATARTDRAAGRSEETITSARAIAAEAAEARAFGVEAEAWQLAALARFDVLARSEARSDLRHAAVAAEAAGDDHLRAAIYLDLARAEEYLQDSVAVDQLVAEARAIVARDNDTVLGWRVKLGEARAALGRHEPAQAVELVTAAIAAHRKLVPTEDLDDVDLEIKRLDALDDLDGRTDEALAAGERAVALAERLLGPEHPNLVRPLMAQAYILLVLNRDDDALRVATRAHKLAMTHDRTWDTAKFLGTALARTGHRDDAERLYATTLAGTSTDDSREIALLWLARADNLAQLGRHAEALAAVERTIPVLRRDSFAGNNLANALVLAGELHEALGHREEALGWYVEATHTFMEYLDRSIGVDVEVDLARVLRDLHRPEEALPHAERAVAAATGDADKLARARLAVAQTLVALHRDPARARELLEAARATFVARKLTDELAEADALRAKL
jgi:tetratricopeptide (TPR) repeat protein